MKKFISIILVVLVFLSLCSPVLAKEDSTTIEYFDDGSYIITEIVETHNNVSPYAISTKSGYKTVNGYSDSGAKQFSLTVHGTFNYNGTVARATASSYSYSISNSAWSFLNGSSSYTANNATATGRFTSYGNTKSVSVTLYCDQDGNLY